MSVASSPGTKALVLIAGLLLAGTYTDAAPRLFVPVPGPARSDASAEAQGQAASGGLWRVDLPGLRRRLEQAPREGRPESGRLGPELALPWPDGSERRFRLAEVTVMEPGLAARFPEIRTWRGQGLDDAAQTAQLDLTPSGFHAQILGPGGTVRIDPAPRPGAGERDQVEVRWKHELRRASDPGFRCLVPDRHPEPFAAPNGWTRGGPYPGPRARATLELRTYRLALAATAEYTAAVCKPGPPAVGCALAAMVTSMNRVNGIFEREVALRMVLVQDNDQLVYIDAATDPYSNGQTLEMLDQNQTNTDRVIGSANYDIGHVFGTGSGGSAFGAPCRDADKARGVTGRTSPIGDGFDVDYVAHEMGHQTGATHTFNGTTQNCRGYRVGNNAFEPGSGSTVMSYAGICGAENLQPHADDYFYTNSYWQILTLTTTGVGSTCGTLTPTDNQPPWVAGVPGVTIPMQTPFVLTGTALDPDGDTLTFGWEEFDLGAAGPPNTDDGHRPIFRSLLPTRDPSRTFPRLPDLLSGTTTLGESLPTTTRNLTFVLTVRDNRSDGGGIGRIFTNVGVTSEAGPFRVTSPDGAVAWTGGSLRTVRWDVANTTAAPVGCQRVDVLLSTDGGLDFSSTLADSVPNDGLERLIVPQVSTQTARVKVLCEDNIFFDVSDADFSIQPDATPGPATLATLDRGLASALLLAALALAGSAMRHASGRRQARDQGRSGE